MTKHPKTIRLFSLRTILIVLLSITAGCTAYSTDTRQAASSISAHGDNSTEMYLKASQSLLTRLLPNHTQDFIFEWIPPIKGNDVFELQSKKGKILIKGNNGVSMASALNWYLEHYCNCHFSLNYSRIRLPNPLPKIRKKIRKISPFKFRNFFNYCAFGYTMPWWDWQKWQQMIDYMALKGINMPLAITGQEAVWQQVYRKLNLRDSQIKNFFAGPAYLPWGWMGNIDGLAGPLPQQWIDSHQTLQQKILSRQRELGMTPILQGFTGHVPAAIKTLFPQAKIHQTTPWAGMPGTWFLDPGDPLFMKIGKSFIETQTRLYGSNHLYNADCFNEINPLTNDPKFISDIGNAVYTSMSAADPKAIWVFQGWFFHFQADFWHPPQAKALLSKVPNHKMIGLDLWGETNPVWEKTNAFYGKPWIWNALLFLSQQVNLSGDISNIQKNINHAMAANNPDSLIGIGIMMEGFGYNPVIQEFITGKTWHPEPVDLPKWISAYAQRRYGTNDERVQKAWQLLLKGPYSRNISNGYESIICHTPKLARFKPTSADPFGVGYNANTTAKACKLLLECAPQLQHIPTYRFDVTHVTREMMDNLANLFNYNILDAYQKKDVVAFDQNTRQFLQLILDLDDLLKTNEHFLLGKWLADAGRWGNNKEAKAFYRWNARALITMWEPARKSQLRDYAAKQWSGLLKGFYLLRWKLFIKGLRSSLIDKKRFNKKQFFRDLKELEMRWLNQDNHYPSVPNGNTLEIARNLYHKYIQFYPSQEPFHGSRTDKNVK
jgi:alpha-N-acetylglucosaminidase